MATDKFDSGKINFVGVAPYFVTVSVAVVVVSLLLAVFKGYKLGVDFAGGTEVQVQFQQPVDASKVRQFTEKEGFNQAFVQSVGGEKEFVIRLPTVTGKSDKETNELLTSTIKKLTDGLTSNFQSEGALVRRIDTVGPQVGTELSRGGILAAFYCLLAILIYVGLRFDFIYAQGAVLCTFFDAITTMGVLSLIGHELTTQTVAAVLTLIGYSLNDTIVIFDRIRENVAGYKNQKLTDVVNLSVNQTWVRSIKTSMTVMLAVSAMYFKAGGTIEDFAFIIGIGVIIGTYSSIYVASPLMMFGKKIFAKAA